MGKEAKTLLFAGHLLFLTSCSSLSNLTLNSSLNSQHEVRFGENITFQCITRGSPILTWGSREYIGDRIEFLKVHSNGTTVTPNPYASATLIGVYTDEDGQSVIVSELSIAVQGTILHSSVTCLHAGSGQHETIAFQLTNAPVLTCSNKSVCPGEFLTFTCEVRNSSILAWESYQYIEPRGSRLELLFSEPVGTVKYSEINSAVFTNLTEKYVQNGVSVFVAQLSILERLYHPDDVKVVCVNVDLGTENCCLLRKNNSCYTTTTSKDKSTEQSNITGGNNGPLIAVSVPLIIVVVTLGFAFVGIVILYVHDGRKKRTSDSISS